MEALVIFLAGFGLSLIFSSRVVMRRERAQARRERRRAERAARRAARPRPDLSFEAITAGPEAAAPGTIGDKLVGTAHYRHKNLRRARAARAAERAERERRIPRLTGAVVVLLCLLALIGGVLATGGLGGGEDSSPEQSVFATPGG